MPLPKPPAPARTVLWLPSHPSIGAVSMDHYWRELERMESRRTTSEQSTDHDIRVTCPLGAAPARSCRRGRLIRACHKYFTYPRLVRRSSAKSEVRAVHVLDHSFAHLLEEVPIRGVFKIVTLHDLTPLHDDAGLTAGEVERFRRTVDHLTLADVVLAVSRASANEALAILELDPAKLQLLPMGVDTARYTRPPQGERPAWLGALEHRAVIFSIGVNQPRKNLESLPAIFEALLSGGRLPEDPMLLRVGDPLGSALRSRLEAVLGVNRVIELGAISAPELVTAYHRADALIFPSRVEGFGLPLLEAMAAGCPVVSTDVTSLPEVGGDAALYFAPDEPEVAAAHLRRLLTDAEWRTSVVQRGITHAARFDWSVHYARLLGIYAEALGTAGV